MNKVVLLTDRPEECETLISCLARRVFIHTCFLFSVHSFGLDGFQKNCTIKKLSRVMIFTGECGNKLAPHGSILLKPNPDKPEKLQVN